MRRFKQKGAQLIEFALVMPVMILLILFIVDAAIFTLGKAVITHASGELARKAIVLSATAWDTSSIKATACTNLRNALISFSGSKPTTCTSAAGTADDDLNIEITPTNSASALSFNTPVIVTITYKPVGLFWNVANKLNPDYAGSSAITLTSTTSMSHE